MQASNGVTDISLAESGLATRSACLPPPNRSPQFPRLRNALYLSPPKQDFTEVAVLLRQTHQSEDLHRQTYKAKAYPETPTKRRPTPPDLQSKSLPRDTYKAKTYTAKPNSEILQRQGMERQDSPPYHHPGVFSTNPRETNVTKKAEETVDEGPIGEWGRRREEGEGGRSRNCDWEHCRLCIQKLT